MVLENDEFYVLITRLKHGFGVYIFRTLFVVLCILIFGVGATDICTSTVGDMLYLV